MTLYKIHIDNRNYGSWSIFKATTMEPILLDNFNPVEHKLFTDDTFTYDNNLVTIINSPIRNDRANIPSVLILDNNKTYGREIKHNDTKGRLLYKCIPDDTRIPAFLVPYEIKHMGFSKVQPNLYVTISYNHWDEKHPYAKLSQTIGPIDVLCNFYEYQLYCKSLNNSIQKFNKDTKDAIKANNLEKTDESNTFITEICNKYPQIEDRTDWKIFTIDPANSLDYDDGFSIKKLNDNQVLLSIYIANVTIWMDCLNLWTSFSKRISTIYLPDRKRPMLPTILSDCLCSLQQKVRRFAFTMDITLDNNGNIMSIRYTNNVVKVFKNFIYEERGLLCDTDYRHLLETVTQMATKYPYMNNIRDSHDLVSYLMIFMNYHCAKELLKSQNGIFRSTIVKQNSLPSSLPSSIPEDVQKFIKIWTSSSAQYIDLNSIKNYNGTLIRHDNLELDAYIHITSPIRRLVDLLNIIKFQQNHLLIALSPDAINFYDKWIDELDYINTTMRSIRKIQNDCSLLDMCHNNPEILEKSYDGYCFDKITRNDGLKQYIVFLPEIKLTSKITIGEDLKNYEKKQYKLFLFNNEEKFKRKIRLQLTM